MLVVWSALLGVLIFMGIIVVTLVFGAAAHRAEKKELLRSETERLAGLDGDVTAETPHPIHDRYVEA
ncbi:hypothetical protein [Hyalangium minutum]|uniref:Uncharacterized protein n=1 Tax=Hyalangium minutum TaxID=394096 RepID=A0A085WU34_9BACT|nr:hypothetical protein [Hyalangium minutum]KFE71197.1 hypothetical protein DB31_3327 [Hyalangium minutum]